jgi:hypothetical protein
MDNQVDTDPVSVLLRVSSVLPLTYDIILNTSTIKLAPRRPVAKC